MILGLFTKKRAPAIAPAFFISIDVLCRFAMLPGCVQFTVPSGRSGVFFFLRGQMYTSDSIFIKMTFFFCVIVNLGMRQFLIGNETGR